MPSVESRKKADKSIDYKGVARVYGVGKKSQWGFSSRAKALSWAEHEEEKMRSQKTGALILTTLEEALIRYRDEVSIDKRGEKWERVRINMFLKGKKTQAKLPLKTHMSNIVESQLVAWRDVRVKEVQGSSVRREMNLLRSIFVKAMTEWNMIEKGKNPMAEIERPPGNPARTARHKDEQRDRILNALGYMEDMPVITLKQEVAVVYLIALETMMRSKEIVEMFKDQLFLDQRFVHLEAGRTKNSEARDVPLSMRAIELFKKVIGKSYPPNEDGRVRVFGMANGTRDVYFREARNAAGIAGITFHDSRATALTRLTKKIQNPVTLARASGHKNINNVMTYYRESATEIAELLD